MSSIVREPDLICFQAMHIRRVNGLTIGNVAGYELVLPNGTVLSVTSKDEDLWFGLIHVGVFKGHHTQIGMNNFVRFPFQGLISWPVDLLIGNSHWILTRSLAGRLSFLLGGPTQRNQNGPAQFPREG